MRRCGRRLASGREVPPPGYGTSSGVRLSSGYAADRPAAAGLGGAVVVAACALVGIFLIVAHVAMIAGMLDPSGVGWDATHVMNDGPTMDGATQRPPAPRASRCPDRRRPGHSCRRHAADRASATLHQTSTQPSGRPPDA
ncbi:DUF6803 family protein [Cellulomonas hominis]